jgi:transcription elongation factor Elf1
MISINAPIWHKSTVFLQKYYKFLNQKVMANFYCEYCGAKYSSVSALTNGTCYRHPNGANKGKHKLYEGSEKNKYTCKYCGTSYSSISALTNGTCSRHPNGANKGKHAPTL